MQRKLLVLAGSIVLISVAFFIFIIKNKERPLVQNPQEMPKESKETLKETSVRNAPTISASQPKPVSENPPPSKEEWKEFEALLRSLEESEGEAEGTQPDTAAEAEGSETRISPELEEIFIGFKQFVEQLRALYKERLPFEPEFADLNHRQMEILKQLTGASEEETKRLIEELHRNEERMETLKAILNPLVERQHQLENEFAQRYGLTIEEFAIRHYKVYKAWEKERR